MIRAFFAESASRGFWLLMFDDSSAAAAVVDFCILGHVGNLAGGVACLSRFLLDAAFWEGRLFIMYSMAGIFRYFREKSLDYRKNGYLCNASWSE